MMTRLRACCRRGGGRRFGPALAVLLAAFGAMAQGQAPTRADAARSELSAGFLGRSLALRLVLDRPVPFRVFTLDAPRRLIVDFQGLDWTGFDPGALDPARAVEAAEAVRVGPIRPGWARLVLDLTRPLTLATAEMRREPGGAVLEVRLRRVSADRFAALAGPPPGDWLPATFPVPPGIAGDGPVTIAVDPGHGGIDPGAVHAGIAEKDVVLAFAEALADELAGSGRYRVLTTRTGDDFLGLDERVGRAREAGARAFLSLHANAAPDQAIGGAIVFTLAADASSRAAAARAAIENRADARGGLAAAPDEAVAAALDGLARARTAPRARTLARRLAAALAELPGGINPNARQAADFAVLRAPEMPSVLLELGFLSNPADRARMLDPAWRADAAGAVRAALDAWLAEGG